MVSEINSESEPKTHTIFTYRVEEHEIDDGFDVLDCIFINDENERNSSFFPDFGF